MNYTNAILPSFRPLSDSRFGLTMCANPDAVFYSVMTMRFRLLAFLAVTTITSALPDDAQIASTELVAPILEITGGNLNYNKMAEVVKGLAASCYKSQMIDSEHAESFEPHLGAG
jgi:hypothetical protein